MTMFYEEKMFEGVLYYRTTPQGEWKVKEVAPPPQSGKESVEDWLIEQSEHPLMGARYTFNEVVALINQYTAAKAASPDSREEGKDWVERYMELRGVHNMPDSINILVKEVAAAPGSDAVASAPVEQDGQDGMWDDVIAICAKNKYNTATIAELNPKYTITKK